MKRILKHASHYIRGAFYYPLYLHRYRNRISAEAKEKEQVVTVKIEDIAYKLQLHVAEGGLAEDLYIASIREYPNVIFFKNFIERHATSIETFIGIGANIGYYAVLTQKILRKAKSSARIFALEPIKSTFTRLLRNISLNQANNIQAINVGIGDKDEVAEMFVMKQRNLSKVHNGGAVVTGDLERVEKIPLHTLSFLFSKYSIPKRNVIMRCDIEGYEYNLIVGNKNFLKSLTNAHIIMEFHSFYLHAEKSTEMLRVLKSIGFELNQVVSCEPQYFVMMPKLIRKLLIKLFLFQYDGDVLGKIERLRTIDDVIREVKDENNALYFYPNLHLYLSKK